MSASHYPNLMKSSMELTKEVEEKKTSLAEIIISNDKASEKLEKIKMFILKIRVANKDNGKNLTKAFENLDANFFGTNIDDFNRLTSLLETAISPAAKFTLLIEDIGKVFRSDLSEDKKVSMIGDLLI